MKMMINILIFVALVSSLEAKEQVPAGTIIACRLERPYKFRRLFVRSPRNSLTKYTLFARNTLTPAPRNNVARYSLRWTVAPGRLHERARSLGVRSSDPVWLMIEAD